MRSITRRNFLAAALTLGAAGFAACSQGESTLVTQPVTDAESLRLDENAALNYAEDNMDVPCTDVTEPLRLLRQDYLEAAAASVPVSAAFYADFFTGYFYSQYFASVMALVEQETDPFDLSPTQSIDLTAQQAANRAATLMRRQHPDWILIDTALYCYRAASGETGSDRPYWAVFQFIEEPTDPGLVAFGALLRLDAITGQLVYYGCTMPRVAIQDQQAVHHKGDAAYALPIIQQFFQDARLPFACVSLEEDPAMRLSLNGRWLAALDSGGTARVEIDLHAGYHNYVIDYSLLS